jgi:SOS-response transcriptional repressor LexA
MASLHSGGESWNFARNPATGRMTLWSQGSEKAHWVGQGAGLVMVAANSCNSSVAMVRLARSYRDWAEGSPLTVLGEVAAGRYDITVAYHASAEAAETLLIPPEYARLGYFALRVRGDSMRDAGIADGDFVIIRPQGDADNGDLVVAGLSDSDDPNGYVTLKQFFREEDHVRLRPANANMAPIHLYPQHSSGPVNIQGKVVAVVRMEEEDWLE